jgi:hypothetical protein
MSAITSSTFYIEIPGDREWNTIPPKCVVEAMPFALTDKENSLSELAQEKLKILCFQDFGWWEVIPKSWVMECSSPARTLTDLYLLLFTGCSRRWAYCLELPYLGRYEWRTYACQSKEKEID